jgi:hypothetical protein
LHGPAAFVAVAVAVAALVVAETFAPAEVTAAVAPASSPVAACREEQPRAATAIAKAQLLIVRYLSRPAQPGQVPETKRFAAPAAFPALDLTRCVPGRMTRAP